jgi:hypothetical protein
MTHKANKVWKIEGKNTIGWRASARHLGNLYTWAQAEAEIARVINSSPYLGKIGGAYRIVRA